MHKKFRDERIANKKWTEERIATLGFLVGCGWDGERVATYFGTTRGNIFRQALRFGLSFREAARENDALRAAAAQRGITQEELVARLLSEIDLCPVLIDNSLDDDVRS
jgi:hypothetical protein